MTPQEKKQLQVMACKVRMGVIEGVHAAKSGHPGGSLSAADMFTYLYFKELRVDPKNPHWEDRDRFVLSKGHTAPGLYATLALRGFFPVEDLVTLRKLGSYLQGHPNMNSVPGVDMSTGSLGQGISVACGMALASRLNGALGTVYGVMLLVAMFCNALASLVGMMAYLEQKSARVQRRRKVLLAVSCLLVWAGSLLGFGEVISVVYPIFGYISIAFLVFMVIHFLCAKKAERNGAV